MRPAPQADRYRVLVRADGWITRPGDFRTKLGLHAFRSTLLSIAMSAPQNTKPEQIKKYVSRYTI